MSKITGKKLATDLCKEFPAATTGALATMLYKRHKDWFPTKNAANCAIRLALGTKGKVSRRGATIPRECHAKCCPPSSSEPWLPLRIDVPCRVLSLSDIHIPYHSKQAVEAAVAHGRALNPDVVLLNGDIQDFYRISRFQVDPKKRPLTHEIELGRQFLGWLREQFPDARMIFKLGNHDERWNKYVWSKAPELAGVDCMEIHEILKFSDIGCERIDDEPVLVGKLPIFHGHELGQGVFSPVNAARGSYLRAKDTVLVGHWHQSSSNGESNWRHDETMTWSQGCLCDLTPEYSRVNRWNWGFAYVEAGAYGEFDLHNYRISNDFQVRAA